MPKWIQENKWKDEDVFIIGGGDSLKTFDWNLLKPHLTIGCNDAFRLGKDVCKICIFGDIDWFEFNKKLLEGFGGVVMTNCAQLRNKNIPWLFTIGRRASGLHNDAIGWNKNTGAAAVNLALILGAKNVFLLGFDMMLSTRGKANWHDNNINKPDAEVYPKFLSGFHFVNRDLRTKFPDSAIINITNNSKLDLFPKINVEEFWSNYNA